MEHSTNKNQLLFLNLDNKTTTLFEPTSYVIPYNEFRLVINVFLTHSNEDAYTYEFISDFSHVKVSAEQDKKFAEAYFPADGNNIIIGTQVVYDTNTELSSHLNYKVCLDSSFQNTTAGSLARPDFGRNVFLVLKQILINFPLKRMEKQNQDNSMSCLLPESLLSDSSFQNVQLQQENKLEQKKGHSKLHLNTNAPLFRSFSSPPGQSTSTLPFPTDTQNSVTNFGQGSEGFLNNPFNNFGAEPNAASHDNNSKIFSNEINSYFNTPLFSQNFNLTHFEQPPFGQQLQPLTTVATEQNYNNLDPLPPGLGSYASDPSHQYSAPPQHFGQRPQNLNSFKNRGLHVDTKFTGYTNHIIMEASAENTPSEIPNAEGDPLNFERTKPRGPNNLYTAVLSGRKSDNMMTNSPCLSAGKLRNRYFGDMSAPGSDYENSPATPKIGNYDSQDFDDAEDTMGVEETIENFRVEDHLGHLVEFAKTYNGSRLLQKFFPRANQDEVELVIDEIEGSIDELMLDPYANYMFQTLAQSCSAEQRYRLLQNIAPSMVKVACDRKGTHSLQAIVSLVSRDAEEKLILEALEGNMVNLAFDSQGTHLIQKLIVSISLANIWFIYQPLIERFNEVVSHSFGLCVLKQLMTKVESNSELKGRVVQLLYDNFEDLIQNPYGNYALQHAMEVWPNDCDPILEKAAEKIVQYSNQKFSSNVIEKCIMTASPEIRKKYLMEIVRSDRVAELMKNKYGNYVLLKILSTADLEGKQLMIQHISKNLNSINVAKHRSRWIQFIEENPLKIPQSQTMRPSIFKTSNFGEGAVAGNKDAGEINSPGSAGQKRKLLREEKSQFFYESGKIPGQRGFNFEENESYNSPDITPNARRMNEGQQNFGSGNKKGKNANQKFYSDKNPHHMSKGGYNNFC